MTAKVIPFPKPRTEAERLELEAQKRRRESIDRILHYAGKLPWIGKTA